MENNYFDIFKRNGTTAEQQYNPAVMYDSPPTEGSV